MIRAINNIKWTRSHVNDIIRYVRTDRTPDHLPQSSYYRFIQLYNDEQFQVIKNKLFFEGKEIVAQEDVNETLERLYNDPSWMHEATSDKKY